MVEKDNKSLPTEICEGVKALKQYLGNTHDVILTQTESKDGQLARFQLILPTDYLGKDRTLYIGFGKSFPQDGLKLELSPSPGLDWPHTLYDSVCLFGVGQNPPYGDAKAVVLSTMSRFSKLMELVIDGSDSEARKREFESEVTTYWRNQLTASDQQLILLDHSTKSGPLYVLSEQRWRPNQGGHYYWFAKDAIALQHYLARLTGTKEAIKYPAQAAYYLILSTVPDIKLLSAASLVKWLSSHIDLDEMKAFEKWLNESRKFDLRWVVLQLPAEELTLHSIVLFNHAVKESAHITYGRRADKRPPSVSNQKNSDKMLYASTHEISRETIHSRNPAYKSSCINQKKVLMVGVGSLGSKVTMELVKEGIENIHLLDPDYLADVNLGRHVLGADDLGRQKVIALKEMINRDMPFVNVSVDSTYLLLRLINNPDFLDQFDLIVVTTADWWSEKDLGQLKSAGGNWALIQGWSEPYTIAGHVLTVPSDSTHDITQFFDSKGNFTHRFTEFPDQGYIPIPGCGAGYIPGGPLGLTQIAAMITRASLEVLTGTETNPTWQYWIGDTSIAAEYSGTYIGPTLPKGMISGTFKSEWPIKGE